MTNQPKWRCIAQLGDAHPMEHGGYWIFIDETGVYPPEAEYLECPDEDVPTGYIAYRFILEDCTYINGILSDNKFHPDHPAWFAKPDTEKAQRPQDTTYLSDLAKHCDKTVKELAEEFCSDDPVVRAWAWREVGLYHGWDNLDHYPLELTRREVKARYKAALYKVKEVSK